MRAKVRSGSRKRQMGIESTAGINARQQDFGSWGTKKKGADVSRKQKKKAVVLKVNISQVWK